MNLHPQLTLISDTVIATRGIPRCHCQCDTRESAPLVPAETRAATSTRGDTRCHCYPRRHALPLLPAGTRVVTVTYAR